MEHLSAIHDLFLIPDLTTIISDYLKDLLLGYAYSKPSLYMTECDIMVTSNKDDLLGEIAGMG